jgi:hypothetical protein
MRRIALAGALVAAVAAVPAQAHDGRGDGNRQGSGNHHANGQRSGAGSHKCRPHRVGWVVRGTVVSQALTRNDDGSYSGDVVVQVRRANRHARGEAAQPQPKTYTLDHAKARFRVSDQAPADGTVDQTDVVAGDRVQLAGKVTKLRKRCDHTGFTATTTVRRAVFHDPRPEPQV